MMDSLTYPTIDDILADPLILAVRQADHVDPKSFETLLRSVARGRTERKSAADAAGAEVEDSTSDGQDMPPAYLCHKILGGRFAIGSCREKASGANRLW